MAEKLNQKEIKEVKDLVEMKPEIDEVVEGHKFRKLLWKTLRIWGGYIVAAIVGLYSIFEVVAKFLTLRN